MRNRFNHSYKLKKNKSSKRRNQINSKALNKASLYLKEERERKSLSRYYLSNRTKISVSVIEALENSWTHKFPEKAYLYKMLRILEKELSLEVNSLNGLLLTSETNKKRKRSIGSAFLDANKIYSGSLSFIIYSIFMLMSILLLNKYYLFLSKSNVITVSPLLQNQSNRSDKDDKLKDKN